MAKSKRRSRAIRLGLVGGCVALADAGTGIGLAASSAGATNYHTAAATTASVSHTLAISGTVEPVSEAAVAFQVAGTVDSVAVKSGQKVSVGQTLATLDTTALADEVTAAENSLAAAQAKLTEDEADESSSSSASSDGTGTAGATADGAIVASPAPVVLTAATSLSGNIQKDQAAVVADQHTVDADMATAAADLSAVASACASTGSTTTTTRPSTTTTPPSSTTTTEPSSTTTSTTAAVTASPTSARCANALSTAGDAEQQVGTDQKALAAAESALADDLAASASSSTSSQNQDGSSTGTASGTGSGASNSGTAVSTGATGNSGGATAKSGSSTAGTGSTGVSGSASTGSSGGSSTSGSGGAGTETDTPQQLASDESTIDSDQASLVRAQQFLAAATLTSPIAGTAEAIGIAQGDSVTADSSTHAIAVVSAGSYEVAASLTTSQVQDVKVGQAAQVTVTGESGELVAKVTRVGPVQDSDGTYTYPVVLTMTSTTGELPSGGAAQAVVDLAAATDVLVVPTSAVHTASAQSSYVYVVKAGKEVRQAVKVGLVGDTYTQITRGLSQGEKVVLADPSEAVPSSSTNSNSRSRTGISGGGGFPTGSASGFTGGAGFRSSAA